MPLLHDESGVTEVIGYVLSFALSAIFLLLALNVFWAARANTEDVTTGVELKTVADQVAGQIIQVAAVSQEFPNAWMNITFPIPQTLSGRLYTVEAAPDKIVLSTNDALLRASSTTFRSEVLDSIDIDGTVDSSNGVVRIEYKLQTDGTRLVTITGE